MKKIIATILVTTMAIAALASCNNNKKPEASTPAPSKTSSPIATTADPNASTPESTVDTTPDNTTFDTRDEVVYTTADLKLRTTNNFNGDGNVEHIVTAGTELKRIGVGNEDPSVSKVVYQDKEYFCGSKYLTTEAPSTAVETTEETVVDEPVAFEATDVTVKVKPDSATVYTEAYKGWSTTNKKNLANFSLTKDTEVKLTGICYESETDREVGWARIEYNNDTYYVRISVLDLSALPAETPAATTAEAPAATTAEAPAATTAEAPAATTAEAPAATTAA